MKRILVFLIPGLLPLLLLLPGSGGFSFASQQAQYSDIAIAHLPNALFLQQTIWHDHQLPLWSPLILGGAPFAAHPLSGLWYPPGWLALLFPLPLGLNLALLLHLLWGAAGMFSFLQALGLGRAAAIFGAAGFASLPRLYAHFGAGHLTLVYALCWLPWLLWAASAGRRRFLYLEGLFLAAIFLADVRWSLYAGLLWVGYKFWLLFTAYRYTNLPQPDAANRKNFYCNTTRVYAWSARREKLLPNLLLAFCLAAPLALPLWEFTRLSSRSALSMADRATFSLPAARLAGLLAPDFGAFHEWQIYPGVLVFLLATLALCGLAAGGQKWFWAGAAVVCLLLALGDQLPFLGWITRLPGFDLLRVPARWVILLQVSLLTLAALAVDGFTREILPGKQKWLRLALFFLASFALVFGIGLWIVTGRLSLAFTWGMAGMLLGVALVAGGLRLPCQRRQIFAWALLGLCLLDWGAVDRSLFLYKPAQGINSQSEAVAQYLSLQPGIFRIYSPSYSMPQQTAAHYGLELADGVDPLQLRRTLEFMQQASGVPQTGYSVTIPPFSGGDPATANQSYAPDAEKLGLLNVRYVLSAYRLDVPDLDYRFKQDGVYLYENLAFRPRAWLENSQGGRANAPVEIQAWRPNAIQIQVEGPGRLVLSEVDYPGWQAWLDGRRVAIEPAYELLRSIQIPAGKHQLLFIFRPTSLWIGLACAAAGWIFLLCSWVVWKKEDVAHG